ncbi:hypothetical protein BSU04_29385 [Caballeronia sordidicola]|uniref:Uncharacterized protein n=1 Tax=Caballeronia sordidicola TaxID=196367 RepID=A0A226WVV6_CABSO|nr:hypothetical protein BSU04_29385 [Caballeronia sordidicola]
MRVVKIQCEPVACRTIRIYENTRMSMLLDRELLSILERPV